MSFKAYLYIGIVLAVIAAAGFIYWKGRSDEEDAQTVKNIETVIPKVERKNEIRNNRPDVAGAAKRMRERTF